MNTNQEQLFTDRHDAGRRLVRLLEDLTGSPDLLVLSLPRGGVPVGYEIARTLDAPMDVLLVRKLGVPGREELAMGAIASGGIEVLNLDIINSLGIEDNIIRAAVTRERTELARREIAFRGERPMPAMEDRKVILVDDGLATGASMRAAIDAVKSRSPRELIVAVPVAARSTADEMGGIVDRFHCVLCPSNLGGVGMWYEDFHQMSDREVRDILSRADGSGEAAT